LCTLLCENPLLNEPGVNIHHSDIKNYNEIIEFANLDIAICDIIQKKTGIFLPFFENFYPFVKENFIKNYDKLLEFAERKNVEYEMKNEITKKFIKEAIEMAIEKAKETTIESDTAQKKKTRMSANCCL
jgi:hypothetical protein